MATGKKSFVVGEAYKSGSDYHLRGTVKDDKFEFIIDDSYYKRYSSSDSKGKVVEIYRNPEMPSLAFQQKSLNVIFAKQWRDSSELKVSAKSSLWIAIILLFVSSIFYVTSRFISTKSE